MRLLIAIVLCYLFFSCEKETKSHHHAIPVGFQNILDAHGGLKSWDSYNTISFTLDSLNTYTVDLKNRRELVKTPSYTMGYDGSTLWMDADTSFKGNPKFLKNLMFYFYAMPFVFADTGVKYDSLGTREVQNQDYQAWKISFEDHTGESPKDEYFVYVDPLTNQLAWLAYTVTFFSGEKMDKLGWIRYQEWQSVEDLLLPQNLTWYNTEDNKPILPRPNPRVFTKVSVIKESLPFEFYSNQDSTFFVN